MSEPTHTPGPWRTGRKVHRTIYCEEHGTEGRLIGVMDRREDAALVAAAPEMLEALRTILTDNAQDAWEAPIGHAEREANHWHRIGSGAIAAVRAALAKAEGRNRAVASFSAQPASAEPVNAPATPGDEAPAKSTASSPALAPDTAKEGGT